MVWRRAQSRCRPRRTRAIGDRWLRTTLLGTSDGGFVYAVALLLGHESLMHISDGSGERLQQVALLGTSLEGMYISP